MDNRLSYEEKKELPDDVFGLPERREYPMPDAAHVRAAEAYFRYCPENLRPQLARAIIPEGSCSESTSRALQCLDTQAYRNRKFVRLSPGIVAGTVTPAAYAVISCP